MIFRKFFNKDADKIDYFTNELGLNRRVVELLLSRGIASKEDILEFLSPTIFHNPFSLKGMRELLDRVFLAKELGDSVLVFGDYDVDGVSATAIMLKALKIFGIKANYYLPNRYVDGYGLTNEVIDKIYDKFQPNLIITVDCGISCYQEVEYAKNKGIDIYVTDHHEIPEILPDTVCVNPKLPNQEYSFKGLCGTGVAYKFAEALLGREEAEQFLPIAAIATIADIVPLLDENRTIVTRGLKLCEKHLPIGLKMMFKEYDISLFKPNSTDISFKICPKLNAPGRMGDAGDSLKLYLETDPVKIVKIIEKIKSHNTRRQEICNKIYEDCERALAKVELLPLRVICLASKVWDKGVLGIVCSRLVEKYHKPVFLFAQEGDMLSGSGRSIDDINIHELLSSLKDILVTFGGHSMAAGLSLKREKYEEFVQKINSFALNQINDEVFMPIKYYDQEITAEEVTPELVKALSALEPFGCDNPRPKFKISANEIEISPMRKFPQHANIKIGSFTMTYFNFLNNLNKMTFARTKSFIFEFQGGGIKALVDSFDGGSFIVEDAYKKLNAIELNELVIDGKGEAQFKLYPQKELLEFVSKTTTTVFGTAFVTYSCFDYVDFAKNYNTQGIYNFNIYSDREIGYNSLLLSPKGVSWAKNFSKIVFLSPVIDTKFISALNKISKAEIYVPLEKQGSFKHFAGMDLSREGYGKIYKALATKAGRAVYNVFELYDGLDALKDISFQTFYGALLVFNELGLIKIAENDLVTIYLDRKTKKDLQESKIYNKLWALKKAFKGERV